MHEAIKVHRCQQERLASASAGRRLLKVLDQAYRKHDKLGGTPSQRENFQCLCMYVCARMCAWAQDICLYVHSSVCIVLYICLGLFVPARVFTLALFVAESACCVDQHLLGRQYGKACATTKRTPCLCHQSQKILGFNVAYNVRIHAKLVCNACFWCACFHQLYSTVQFFPHVGQGQLRGRCLRIGILQSVPDSIVEMSFDASFSADAIQGTHHGFFGDLLVRHILFCDRHKIFPGYHAAMKIEKQPLHIGRASV